MKLCLEFLKFTNCTSTIMIKEKIKLNLKMAKIYKIHQQIEHNLWMQKLNNNELFQLINSYISLISHPTLSYLTYLLYLPKLTLPLFHSIYIYFFPCLNPILVNESFLSSICIVNRRFKCKHIIFQIIDSFFFLKMYVCKLCMYAIQQSLILPFIHPFEVGKKKGIK